eukprot:scaffold2067_cov379-Prasinococcus_capsulatus_cf.AAC.6
MTPFSGNHTVGRLSLRLTMLADIYAVEGLMMICASLLGRPAMPILAAFSFDSYAACRRP